MNFIPKNRLSIFAFFLTSFLGGESVLLAVTPSLPVAVGNLGRRCIEESLGDTPSNARSITSLAGEVAQAIPGALSSTAQCVADSYAYQSLMYYFKKPISTPEEGYSILSSTDNFLSWTAKIIVGGAIALSARYAYKNCSAVRTAVKLPFTVAKGTVKCAGQLVIGTGNLVIGGIKAVGSAVFC